MNGKSLGFLALFIAFTGYTLFLALTVPGSVAAIPPLVLREPWAMQILVDLAIALVLFMAWMIPDARQRGIAAWPYVLAILAVGSIGALAYMTHRSLREARPPASS